MIELMAQIFRFGVVGLTAATVHFGTVVFLVQYFEYAPLVANVIAFLFSFQVSYWGHRGWTFQDADVMHRQAIPKLLLVQVINLIANETLFYIFLSFHLPYQVALLLVLSILPIFTFISSKFWIFK